LRESRAGRFTVKAMEAVKILEVQPRRTPRRKRARNVQTVTAGTGEALPGRNALRIAWNSLSYNRCGAGKWIGRREGVGGGRSTDRAVWTTQPAVREGPLLRSRVMSAKEVPGECRSG
jgi:hypothetical protein